MANIALNKPSGGQLILSPEDGTSTETVTIPSVGVGKVLQVVQGSSNSTMTFTTFNVDLETNVTATITPTRADSKILILSSVSVSKVSNSNLWTDMTIYKNGNGLISLENSFLYTANTNNRYDRASFEWLDTASSTSPITYTIYINIAGSGTCRVNPDNGRSVITLMEVAA